MYNSFDLNHCPFFAGMPVHAYNTSGCPYIANTQMHNMALWNQFPGQCLPNKNQANTGNPILLRDYGPDPFVVDIEEVTKQNKNFRLALWTGKHLQLTLMSINIGEDIGLETHPNLDQFIRIEEGRGIVRMGDSKDRLNFQANVRDDYAFVIPAGKWHNLINTGNRPLKLYSIYAPPQHPYGTVHKTREEAEEHH